MKKTRLMLGIKTIATWVSAMILTGCVTPVVTYIPKTNIAMRAKQNPNSIEVLTDRPVRSFMTLGVMGLGGRPLNGFQDLINEAKRKAAEVGGDFVWVVKAGTVDQHYMIPGYSTYSSDITGTFTANQFGANGNINGYAHGFSRGPIFGTQHLANMRVVIGMYMPATLALETRFDEATKKPYVAGFKLKSKAEMAGVKVGDELLGVDGIDGADLQALNKHMLSKRPGETVKLSVLRNGVRHDVNVELVPN